VGVNLRTVLSRLNIRLLRRVLMNIVITDEDSYVVSYIHYFCRYLFKKITIMI
jgi:hypothetical protein